MLFSCKNEIEEIKAITGDSELPVKIIKNGTFHYTEESNLVNTLIASELKRFEGEDPRIEVYGGFTMLIYDSLERVDASIEAEEGIFYDLEGRLECYKNVIAVNAEQDSLLTEELIWVQDSNLVYSNKFVEISNEDGTIYSQGLVTDSHFKRYKLKQVSGDININEDQKENQQDNDGSK
ncbi:MAG: LPS export ABC transporter periplasmic protein LptC [Bacteroidota bacterium]